MTFSAEIDKAKESNQILTSYQLEYCIMKIKIDYLN